MALNGTTALLPRVCDEPKLITETAGLAVSVAYSVRKPATDGCVTVTLTETALAVAGTAHWPTTGTTRVLPPASGVGPPSEASRVSKKRQGNTV